MKGSATLLIASAVAAGAFVLLGSKKASAQPARPGAPTPQPYVPPAAPKPGQTQPTPAPLPYWPDWLPSPGDDVKLPPADPNAPGGSVPYWPDWLPNPGDSSNGS